MTSVRCGSAGTGLAAYKMGVLGGSLVSQPNGVVGGAQWEGRSSAGLGLAARRREWADSFRCAPRVLVSQLMVYGVHMGALAGSARLASLRTHDEGNKGGGMITWN